MNRASANLTDFPKMVPASSGNPQQKYERVDTHFAVHGSEGGANAGWLRPISSSIASSLAGLDKLTAIPGVENVEPQMLTKPAHKQ